MAYILWPKHIFFFLIIGTAAGQTHYQVGRGIADCTGLAGEGALYGYGRPDQDARGIHMRQYVRSFIIADNNARVAISVTDTIMVTTEVQLEVLKKLKKLYGALYMEQNVFLTAQHSHSTPGGFQSYELYAIPAAGFINETFNALVNGIIESIQKAHNDLKPGKLYFNQGVVLNTTINRSLPAYMNNPAEERARYQYDTDKDVVIIKMTDMNDAGLGMLNFFPVHTVSLNNTNHYISSDNKGYAAQLFERSMNPGKLPGQGDFVAAFAQKAEGDVSPNLNGTVCTDTGEPCDYLTSSCGSDNNTEKCHGRGPGRDMFESMRIIGQRQFVAAEQLYGGANTPMSGPIDSRHQYVNLTNIQLTINGQSVTTCKPAVGFSFAAGATDGPGGWPFYQGNIWGDPEIEAVRNDIFGAPSEEIKACQAPKPVLLHTGEFKKNESDNYWQPEILPIQIVRIADLVLLGVGSEITTMAGRRLAETVRKTLTENGYPSSTKVVVVALTNAFAHYITTREEYQIQRYEGACTNYGQYTLEAYQKKFSDLALAMAKGEASPAGPTPPSLRHKVSAALGPILTDVPPAGRNFGDILTDVNPQYTKGSTASVKFVAGNPRNDMKKDGTFLEVEKKGSDGSWSALYRDSHHETKFLWERQCGNDNDDCGGQQESNATILWDIPAAEAVGTYCLRHYGNWRDATGTVSSYIGTSSEFQVVSV